MSLQEKIATDIRHAMREKSEIKLGTLRMLKSDIQYEQTKTGAKDITDDAVEKIIKRAVKKRQEAAEQYQAAGRPELAEKETAELQILEAYLPKSVPESEIRARAQEIIAGSTHKNFGALMGQVMTVFKGQNVDGTLVSKIVKEMLV